MRKALYILGQLNDADVDWIIRYGRRQAVPAGSVLIRQGEKAGAVFLVLAGQFSVVDEQLQGRELARLSSGEVLGEMSFVDARPPSATVRALKDSLVVALPAQELAARLARDDGFAARFYRAIATFLSDRLRATVGTLGYGEPATGISDEEQPDELDLNVLDSVHLAGGRFDRILKALSA